MVSTSSRTVLRCERMALASSAASCRRSCLSLWSRMRYEASAMPMSDVSMTCQMASQLPPHVLKLILDGLQPLALLAVHAVHLLVHDFTRARMLPSVRMLERSCRRRAPRSAGVELGDSQAPLPRFMIDWQT